MIPAVQEVCGRSSTYILSFDNHLSDFFSHINALNRDLFYINDYKICKSYRPYFVTILFYAFRENPQAANPRINCKLNSVMLFLSCNVAGLVYSGCGNIIHQLTYCLDFVCFCTNDDT